MKQAILPLPPSSHKTVVFHRKAGIVWLILLKSTIYTFHYAVDLALLLYSAFCSGSFLQT